MCIVTKFANKGSLTWHLKVEYHTLTWADKLRLATQIASGIASLHEEGIYHRDLHGGNILIDDEGNAMLTDFGASTIMEERVVRNIQQYAIEEVPSVEGQAKFISQHITGLKAKKTGGPKTVTDDPLIGVMAYIAPERFRNPSYFDAKCDIYSLGVLLWELTTGHSAFAKVPQDVNLAVAIMNGKREISVEDTPAEYKALYERCWHSVPEKRPSMAEILSTLTKIRASMTPAQLASTRTCNKTFYSSGTFYLD
jgi:serine/threonine protein kinase